MFYEEELSTIGKDFKSNLQYVFNDPQGDYSIIYASCNFPDYTIPAPPEKINWTEDLWLEMPLSFCLSPSFAGFSSQFIKLTFCNGVWIAHIDLLPR